VPHWALVEQVPQVPATQAVPPPHWLFSVHATHAPLMQARPEGLPGPSTTILQSENVVHAAQTLLMHACPFLHENGPPIAHPWT